MGEREDLIAEIERREREKLIEEIKRRENLAAGQEPKSNPIAQAASKIFEPIGDPLSRFTELPAAIESTYESVRSSFPQTQEAAQRSKQIVDRNRPLLETPLGTATEIGVQSLPLATAAVLGGPAAVAAGMSKLPKALQVAGNVISAGTGGYLLGEPDQKGTVAGGAAGIQTAIEGGKMVLPKAVKAGMKYGGKAMDKIVEKVADLFRLNPGLELDQAATRLQELVPDIEIPLGSSARNWIVKRAAQIAEYVPMVSAGAKQQAAERSVTRKLFDKAEGLDAPGKVPISRRIDPPPEVSFFSKEGVGNFLKGIAGITNKNDPAWREFNKRFAMMDKRVRQQYNDIINDRDFDAMETYENVFTGLASNENPMWREVLPRITDFMRSTVNRRTGKVAGEKIGTLKRDLRKIQDHPDATQTDIDAIDMVIRQIDDDVAKQLPPEDAAKWAELNSLYPSRKIMQDAVADAPLGDVTPTALRSSMEKITPDVSRARGTGTMQEIIDTSEKVLGQRKPPQSTSPFALAAVMGTMMIDAGMTTAALAAIRASRSDVVQDLAAGRLPKWLAVPKEFEKEWQEKFLKMSKSDITKFLDEIANPATSAITAEQTLGEQ